MNFGNGIFLAGPWASRVALCRADAPALPLELAGEREDVLFGAPDRLPGPRLLRVCGSPDPVVFLLFKSKFPVVDRQRRRAPT
jgi:hypothetical protein